MRNAGRAISLSLSKSGALGTAAAALLLPMAASAQVPQTGWYVGLGLIGAYSTLDDFSADGTLGPTDLEHDDDWVGGVAGKIGYRLSNAPVRFELEVAHRYRFDLDAREEMAGGGPVLLAADAVDYETNIGTTSALLTALVEWRTASAFTPFAGLTIGWAHHDVKTERTDLITGDRDRRKTSDDNFAWGALVGVEWAFAQRWSAEVAYRYIDLGSISTGRLDGGQRLRADDYASHDLLLSVLYRF